MDAAVLVVVVTGETKPCDNNIAQLRKIFTGPYFDVQILTVPNPTELPNDHTLTPTQHLENYRMAQALAYAAEGPYTPDHRGIVTAERRWSTLPVLVIKDSSVVSATNMQGPIMVALEQAPTADVFFLCKWLDACDKYTDLSELEGYSLKWSLQPTATQAILYRTLARDYFYEELQRGSSSKSGDASGSSQSYRQALSFSQLLNEEIAQGNIRAAVFVPNLVHFDMKVATHISDYNKLNQCATVPTSSTTNNKGLLWTIVALIVLMIVAWISIQIVPRR